jgi:hypothetical protein
VVALTAGAVHPIALYLLLCVLGTATVIAGAFAGREFDRYRKVRRRLAAATVRVPVPVLLTTPGPPSFTVGGQVVGGHTQIVQDVPPVQTDTASGAVTSAAVRDQSAMADQSVDMSTQGDAGQPG